jgi:hypothetical protein
MFLCTLCIFHAKDSVRFKLNRRSLGIPRVTGPSLMNSQGKIDRLFPSIRKKK